MSKENENIMTEEEILEEEFFEEEYEEEKEKNLIQKVLSGVKKHGKKIAVGAAVAAVSVIGYTLLKKGSNSDSDSDYNSDILSIDLDPIDVTESCEEIE